VFHTVAKIIGKSDCDHNELSNIIRKWCNFLRDHHDTEMDNIIIASNKFTTSVQLFQERIESVAEGGDWRKVFLEDTNISNNFHNHQDGSRENHKNHEHHGNHENHKDKVRHAAERSDLTRENVQVHHDLDCADKNSHTNNADDSLHTLRRPTRTKHEYNTECTLHVKKCKESLVPIMIREKICRETNPQNLCRYVNVVNGMYFSIHSKKPSTEELLYYVNLLEKKEINSQDLYKLI